MWNPGRGMLCFLVYNIYPARILWGMWVPWFRCALAGSDPDESRVAPDRHRRVFVIETLSVILQVISFQLAGRRIFMMAPLHHHFELKGWSEWQVVTGFWGFLFLLALLTLIDLGWK